MYLSDVLPLYHGLGQLFGSASVEAALATPFCPQSSPDLTSPNALSTRRCTRSSFALSGSCHCSNLTRRRKNAITLRGGRDPRPLRMVLHGCFVFTCVVHLWLEWAKDPPIGLPSTNEALRIAFRRSCEVLAGVDLLARYALPTEYGSQLFSEIKETASALAERSAR